MAFFDPIIVLFQILFAKLVDWISRKLYDSAIIFTTVWEDPRCDAAIMNLKKEDKMIIITSAGCNALAHAAAGIGHVYCIDKNPCQNFLMDLKIAAIKELDYDTFWKVFGEGRHPTFCKDVYPKLRKHLSVPGQKFWDKRARRYWEKSWYYTNLYNNGCSGRIGWLVRLCMQLYPGLYKDVKELFEAKSIEEQKELYHKKIEHKLWNPVLFAIANSSTLYSWCGIPPSQQNFILAEGGLGVFCRKSLQYALTDLPIHESYFWRLYAVGNYTKTCCPEYLKEENFYKLKNGLVNNISTHTCTITEFLEQYPNNDISKFLLLDHQDWLVDHPEILSAEWDQILSHCTPDAQFLWRSSAAEPVFILNTEVTYKGKKRRLGDLVKLNPKTEALHKLDRVHTYTSFSAAELVV